MAVAAVVLVAVAVAEAAAVAVSDVTSKAAAVKTTIATTAGQLQPPQQEQLQVTLQQPQ